MALREIKCDGRLQCGSGDATAAVRILANTGAPMRLNGWSNPVVIDLAGVRASDKGIDIALNHRDSEILGVVGSASIDAIDSVGLWVNGEILAETEEAQHVVGMSRRGRIWEASVGLAVESVESVQPGASVEVNGRMHSGPIEIVRSAVLREVSIVVRGADPHTKVILGREQKLNETELAAQATAEQARVNAAREAAAAEIERIAAVRTLASGQPEIAARAIREGWTAERTELEALRANRPAPVAPSGSSDAAEPRVLECALAVRVCGESAVERSGDFSAQVMQAAHTRFRGRIGLRQLIASAARANGWSGDPLNSSDMRDMIRAAFSTLSLPGILGNTANRTIREAFNAVDQSWRSVAAIGSVSDFKASSRYSLTGSLEYEEVPAGGEIPHGTLGEETYSNQADTYGKMLAITRKDLINDDLGAFTRAAQRLGRGAATKLNSVVWTEFLANASTFWTSARGNYQEGSGTALSSTSLTAAEVLFARQTDPDGNPLGAMAKTLVVPVELRATADQLMTSEKVVGTTDRPDANVHRGRYNVVSNPYLSNSAYTGYSTTAWYLLADPADIAVIEVVFLDGQQFPTVESTDADFNTLGIQMRGYHDFGAAKQEYRGGVKSKGAA